LALRKQSPIFQSDETQASDGSPFEAKLQRTTVKNLLLSCTVNTALKTSRYASTAYESLTGVLPKHKIGRQLDVL
ncbi:MAG TPA: hypothetical protein VNH18_06675, partial [Bryobacteraceae bacterium]|nr:hypothetical protein [Bryobacteraceae bacterium]